MKRGAEPITDSLTRIIWEAARPAIRERRGALQEGREPKYWRILCDV